MKTQIIECPHCLHRMKMDSMLDEKLTKSVRPKKDDFTICVSCATALRFDDVDVHIATEEEIALMEPAQLEMMEICKEIIKSEEGQQYIKERKARE